MADSSSPSLISLNDVMMEGPAEARSRDDLHIFSEFEDEDRKRYIRMIHETYKDELPLISRACLFTLWFSDKEVLRQIAHGENGWHPRMVVSRLTCEPNVSFDPVGKIAKRKRDDMAEKTPRARDHKKVEKALERDGEQCVVTRHGRPGLEVAHIVPFRVHKTPRAGLWAILGDFWGARAEAWKQAIIGATDCFNTEQVTNLMALNQLVHGYWEDCYCAFRPVRVADDKMSMDVAFHWLPLLSGKKTDMIPIDQNPFGLGAEKELSKSPGLRMKIYEQETDRVICSGDIFTIRTTDKERLPLPSMELLEMLWDLKRIARMQGAEEDDEDDVESETDSPTVPSFSPSPSLRHLETLPPSRSRSRSKSPLKGVESLSLDDRDSGHLIEESDW